MNDADARVFAAAFLSPLSILIALPFVGSILGVLRGHHLEVLPWVRAAAFILVFAYPGVLFLGLPSYFALRRLNLASIWTAIVIGYLVAACVPFLLQLGGLGGVPLSTLFYWLNPFFLLGPVVAITFWWVAKPRPNQENRQTDPLPHFAGRGAVSSH